jgi:ACS family hexuronate transporter-like MFS transporter
MRDRALAIGIFNAGTAFGSMAAAPIVSVIAVQWGWRAAFLVTGALGFVWVAGWWVLYKLPKDHPRISEEERQLILSDQPQDSGNEKPAPLSRLLAMKETWGCVLVRALTDPISYFLLFWIPLYFQQKHGFNLKEIGMFVWIPYAVAALGNVFSGAMPRWLISRGWELNSARKLTMGLMTCLMFLLCVIVPQATNPVLALVIVAGMMFCHAGWGNIILPAEVFPKSTVGTVTGLGGALGSLMGALSQLYIGKIVDNYGFTPIFIACACMYPLALLMVQMLIGKLGVVRKVS